MEPSSTQVVILTGGKGQRLQPYTTVLPKPLMPIGDTSVLEVLLRQLKQQGLRRITLAVSYLAASGYTLTVVLNFTDHRMVGFASNDKEWFVQQGSFEIVD